MRPDLVVFDLETSGLDPRAHEILEIGAVRVSADLATERGVFERRCRLERPGDADPQALEVNGYSLERWRDAVDRATGLHEFASFIAGGVLAGFNVAFDWGFLNLAFRRAGLSPRIDYHLCDVFSLAYERTAGENIGYTLRTLCQRFGVTFPGDQHHALNDARATLALWRALREPPSRA